MTKVQRPKEQRRSGPKQAKSAESLFNYGVWYLHKFGDTSEHNLRMKMSRKTDNPEWVESAISRLVEMDYLSEKRFAELMVHKGLGSKTWGRARIEMELKRKGVRQEVIKEALEELQDDDPASRAEQVLAKKFRNNPITEQNERARATRYLASRGFDFQSVSKAIAGHNESFRRDL
jgi:regulatory protein